MNLFARREKIFQVKLTLTISTLIVLGAWQKVAGAEAPSAAPVLNPVPKSVFVIPKLIEEGRDPFYPRSNRVPAGASTPGDAPVKTTVVPLVLNGLNLLPGKRTAMINGKTIAEGQTEEVPTSVGLVKVRCVEIKPGNIVVVEVGTQTQELRMRSE